MMRKSMCVPYSLLLLVLTLLVLDFAGNRLLAADWQPATAETAGTLSPREPEILSTRSLTTIQSPSGTIPVGLRSTFMLGLSNGSGDLSWMTGSSIPWDLRYQYLAGGVNTGQNGMSDWATNWQEQANPPNVPYGLFATRYMNDSKNSHTIPVFTYYQILQSQPLQYQETLAAYQAKFTTPATMYAYYADFKVLMDTARQYGGTVIVHVEPDTWGYMQLTSPSGPATYPVSVASSGYPDAAGLPDTAVGFAQLLVRLRDRYAPNVLLADHASSWSTGLDIALNTNMAVNVQAQADLTADWLKALGSGWDLLFVDCADRDAAYYQFVIGSAGHWWDESNMKLPNFTQYAAWTARLNQQLQKRILLWQVPIGNTRMLSMNNTNSHYQDNRVQYFLDSRYGETHINQYAQAGVIGILFGRGNGDTATYTDAAADGITNPPPINANTIVATVTDDDGGYLRQRAQAYYANPYILPVGARAGSLTPASYIPVVLHSGVRSW